MSNFMTVLIEFESEEEQEKEAMFRAAEGLANYLYQFGECEYILDESVNRSEVLVNGRTEPNKLRKQVEDWNEKWMDGPMRMVLTTVEEAYKGSEKSLFDCFEDVVFDNNRAWSATAWQLYKAVSLKNESILSVSPSAIFLTPDYLCARVDEMLMESVRANPERYLIANCNW